MMEKVSLHFLFSNISQTVLQEVSTGGLSAVDKLDVRSDSLRYLLYSQLMCFLFIIRFYIKLLKC